MSSTLWEQAAEDPERHTAAALQWVQSSKAAWMRHGKGTLAGHLAATAGWLEAWGADEETVRAGLCHALFGTQNYQQAVLQVSADRPIVEQVFGARAVHLGLPFAVIDRKALRSATRLLAGGAQIVWPMRLEAAKPPGWAPEATEPVVEDEASMTALMMIDAANECAQVGRWSRVEESLAQGRTAPMSESA